MDGGREMTIGASIYKNKTKEVIYQCGCSVMLSDWCKSFADIICITHHKPIEKIITIEYYN
jgi:hypothetical protein